MSIEEYGKTHKPEISFTVEDTDYISRFNADLRKRATETEQAGYDERQADIERSIQIAMYDAYAESSDGENLRLVAGCEALGASKDSQYVEAVLEGLNHNYLLDDAERNMLNDVVGHLWEMRRKLMAEEQIASAVSKYIETIIAPGFEKSHNKTSPELNIALLALGAGATASFPEFRFAERLMDALHFRTVLSS